MPARRSYTRRHHQSGRGLESLIPMALSIAGPLLKSLTGGARHRRVHRRHTGGTLVRTTRYRY